MGKKFAGHFLGRVMTSPEVFFWHDTKAPPAPDLKRELDGIPQAQEKESKGWQPAGVARLDMPQQEVPKPLKIPPPEHCIKAVSVAGTILVYEQ